MRWKLSKTRRSKSLKCFHCNEYFEGGEIKFALTSLVARNGKQIGIHKECFHKDLVEYIAPDNILRVCHLCGKRIKKGEHLYEKYIYEHKTRIHRDCRPEAIMMHRNNILKNL